MGGIVKDCKACDGKGRIPVKVETSTVSNPVIDMATKATSEVVSAVKSKRKSRAKVKEPVTADMFQDTCTLQEIFMPIGVVQALDPMMEAVLAEPNMTTEEFRRKYPGIAETTSVRDRHGMRVMYASEQKIAPRTVDVSASQDACVSGDAEYKAFEAKEAARNK